MDEELQSLLQWTRGRLTEDQPPWTWYNYMKLQEALEAVIKGRAVKTESLPQSDERPGTHLRLVDSTYRQDTSQYHQDIDDLPLPM